MNSGAKALVAKGYGCSVLTFLSFITIKRSPHVFFHPKELIFLLEAGSREVRVDTAVQSGSGVSENAVRCSDKSRADS